MKKVNINEIKEEAWQSPGGKYAVSFKGISEALGREPASLDLSKRHPFDLEWSRVPPGKCNFPYTRTRLNGNCIWSFPEKAVFATRTARPTLRPVTRSSSVPTNRIKLSTLVTKISFIMYSQIIPSANPGIIPTAGNGK